MKRVLAILGRGLKIGAMAAPAVAAVAFPPLAGLVAEISGHILRVEAELGSGQGIEKHARVVVAVAGVVRASLLPVCAKLGKRNIDPALIDQAVADIVDVFVRLFNAIGALPKSDSPNSN